MTRFLLHQARGIADLFWWARGRPRGAEQEDVALGHARERVPMLVALAFVLGLETAVVGFLLPWPIIHLLDIVAVLQVLGLAASEVTRPHLVGPRRLLLRDGPLFELTVPVAAIAGVHAVRREFEGYHSIRIEEHDGDTELAIVVGGRTDILVELHEPIPITGREGHCRTARRLRLRADDPHASAAAIDAARAAVHLMPNAD